MANDEGTPEEWLHKATEGSEEYQLKLGQHYLTLAHSLVSKEENGSLAVRWLVAASKRGNEIATELLKKCLDTETGITDDNKEDVMWCVKTSTLEKKIRFAAKSMFHTINTAQKEVLSPEEYSSAIKKITGGREEKLLLAAGKSIGEKISENEFVKFMYRRIQGKTHMLPTERSAAYETAGLFDKVVKFPRETVAAVMDCGLEYASNNGFNLVMSCIPTNQIYLLTLFFLYGFLSAKFLLLIVPLIVFYLSYATIIITTLQMFHKKQRMNEVATLAEMLKHYDVGVDIDETKSQYSWNSLTPYLVYFATIPLVVASFSLADKNYIPCSELCILNAVIFGVCFLATSDSHDLVTLLAIGCSFFAGLPVFFHNFPKVPLLSTMIYLVSGSFISIDLFWGLKLNLGIPSICYFLIPLFFIQMALRNSFQGTYRVFVPHLVCYFWFNLITTFYPFSTWIGLTRATVGYLMLPLLIPLGIFIVIFGLIYVVVKLASSDFFGKLFMTILLGSISVVLMQTKKLFGGNINKKFDFVKKILMVAFAVLALIPLIFVQLPTSSEVVIKYLSSANYMEICGSNDIHSLMKQIKCSHFKGSKIVWHGKFISSNVVAIKNDVASMIEVFPTFISKPLACIYGKSFGDCQDMHISDNDYKYCQLMTSLGHPCHLMEHDIYTFNLQIKVAESGYEMLVAADAGIGFKETLLALQLDDEVEIKGTIADALNPMSPKIKLKELRCMNRELDVMKMIEHDSEEFNYRLLEHGLQTAFNFFWHPLVEYVPHDQTVLQ